MRIGMRTVKTMIGAFFSMVAVGGLSLLYWPAVGIIALLSVGNIKCSILRTRMNRVAAFTLTTATALFSFFAVGYITSGLNPFLSLFVPPAFRFELTGGIVVNSVLVIHYLVRENMSWQLTGNEAGLMTTGLVFALLTNVYMPDRAKQLKRNQIQIRKELRNTSRQMAEFLLSKNKGDVQIKCEHLLTFICESQEDVREHQGNYWLRQPLYYETYFSMRRAQANVIKDMSENLKWIQQPVYYGKHVYGLLICTVETFSESNDGRQILVHIEEVYVLYWQVSLPISRPEFEGRTGLFQSLQSFRSFIEIKAEFF